MNKEQYQRQETLIKIATKNLELITKTLIDSTYQETDKTFEFKGSKYTLQQTIKIVDELINLEKSKSDL